MLSQHIQIAPEFVFISVILVWTWGQLLYSYMPKWTKPKGENMPGSETNSKQPGVKMPLADPEIWALSFYIQVHLNKLECRGKFIYFSNLTQIVKLVY